MADRGTIEAPPPRYRVIERERRLVVVDDDNPAAIAQAIAPVRGAMVSGPLGMLKKTSFDGRAVLTTQSLYDLKGPRRLKLDSGSSAMIGWLRILAAALALGFVLLAIWQPATLALLALLFQPKLWRPLRAGITNWLDRFDSAD